MINGMNFKALQWPIGRITQYLMQDEIDCRIDYEGVRSRVDELQIGSPSYQLIEDGTSSDDEWA